MFLLVPYYTGILSTEEYGVADLLLTTVSILVPIFTLDIQDAVMRFTMDFHYEKKSVLSASLKIIFFGTILLVIFSIAFWSTGILSLKIDLLIFLIILFMETAFLNVCSFFCRAIDKVRTMTISSIVNALVFLGSNILFLSVFKKGLNGYLLSYVIGYAALILYVFFSAKLYKYICIVDDKFKKTIRGMLKFCFPLVFSVLAWSINTALDRYILTWIVGVSASGLFAISYKIPNLLSTFQNVFSQAWSISAIKEFDPDDKDGFMSEMYTMMLFAMSVTCSVIMAFNVTFSKILYSNDFFNAWKYVPPLLFAVVLNAMSMFMGSIYTAVKDSKSLSISTLLGVFINIILNVVLIFLYGTYGAAIATVIGNFVTFFYRKVFLRKHIKLKINAFREFMVYFALTIEMLLGIWGNDYIIIQFTAIILILIILRKEMIKTFGFMKQKIYKVRK
ncbi:polysaccharide biosynthesis C-terminal domain-containing protein [Butyrivibrio fibrisolvens]|uniref:oligosaccharide flippase family protein n=1 Tax=Butyrivibrio fibrisolvens TaxID=831 RepID=UPI0024A76B47|nr:polysaccharide biosynthesis C-terminal domain-containing protein [Butyrivibrio fibrisolvens]